MNMYRVVYIAINHGVNKYPVFSCSNLRVICSPTFAEVNVPIEEERKVKVPEHGSHPDRTDTHSRIYDRIIFITK